MYCPGCPFTGGGDPGKWIDISGILAYKDIMQVIESQDITGSFWEMTAAMMYVTWDEDQWVSYDSNVTMEQKVDWGIDHCLGGVMIWALDQNTYDWQALTALLGTDVHGAALLDGVSESSLNAAELAHAYNAYTGAECYASGCVNYSTGSRKAAYSVLSYIHRASYGVITDPDEYLCTTGDTTEYKDSGSQYRMSAPLMLCQCVNGQGGHLMAFALVENLTFGIS